MKPCCKKIKCCEQEKATRAMYPLTLASEGEQVELVAMGKGKKIHERLLSMGIGIGDNVDVIKCQNHGAILIAKGQNRYAIGGGMAKKIFVR